MRGERGHVHDRAAALGLDVGPDGLADVERAGQIDVDHSQPVFIGLIWELARSSPSSVVEEQVDLAVGLGGLLDGGDDGVVVAHVAGDEGRLAARFVDLGDDRFPLGDAPGHQDDLRAFGGEEPPGLGADAAVSACDHRHFAVELAHAVLQLLRTPDALRSGAEMILATVGLSPPGAAARGSARRSRTGRRKSRSSRPRTCRPLACPPGRRLRARRTFRRRRRGWRRRS